MPIDYSQPLRLGFRFCHAADRVDELIADYRKVGIPDADISMPEQDIVDEWVLNGWKLGVYAKGSEAQSAALSELGYERQICHVLGPMIK